MKLSGLSRYILSTCGLLLCLGELHPAFAWEKRPSLEGTLSHPSHHRTHEQKTPSSRQASRYPSTRVLSHNIHHRLRHHPQHRQYQKHKHHQKQKQQQQLQGPAERNTKAISQPYLKGKVSPSVSYQSYSEETTEKRGQRDNDFHEEIAVNMPRKIKASLSNVPNDVFQPSSVLQQSGTSAVSNNVKASANDAHPELADNLPETKRSKYEILPEMSTESSYLPHISSFFDSFFSWWSSKSSSNSPSSLSLSSTQSLSSPPFSHQPSLTAPSNLGQRNSKPQKRFANEMRLAAEPRHHGNRRQSGRQHAFKRTVKTRDWSRDARNMGLQEIRSHDIMLGDAPSDPTKKRRKVHPKRRTKKKKRRGLRSTKKSKIKKKTIETIRNDSEKAYTASARENTTDNVSSRVLGETTSTKKTESGVGEIYYEIKRTWNGKVGKSIVQSTTRKTTSNNIDINVDNFGPSTPSTSTLSINVEHTRKARTYVHLMDDKDLGDINDEKDIIKHNNHDSEKHSQNDDLDSNPAIDIHVRTRQQKWSKTRGDTPIVEQGGPIEREEWDTVKPVNEGREKQEGYVNETNLSKASGDPGEDVLMGKGDKHKEFFETEEIRESGNRVATDAIQPAATSQPGTGIFATVRELVMTVKDLYTQQELNRKSINELFSRYRSQRTDLHLTEAKVSTIEQNLRGVTATLQNLDTTAGGIRQEMANFRNRQHRADRNQRRLRLETERLLSKVNRLDDEHKHQKALHDSNSGHMLASSELSKTSATLEIFSSRLDRLERLDLKRSSRTSKLHKKLDSLEQGLSMAQMNLKDVASDTKDCSDQIGSLRVDLDDLIDNMEISMNPEFLEALKGLGVNSNSIATDSGGTLPSYSNKGEYSGEDVSDDENDAIAYDHSQSLKDDIHLTTKPSRHEQTETGNGSDTPYNTFKNSKNKLRKSRHLDSSSSDTESSPKSLSQVESTTPRVGNKRSHQNNKENTPTSIPSPAFASSDPPSSLLKITTSSHTNNSSQTVESVERKGNHFHLYNVTAITKVYRQREPSHNLLSTQPPSTYNVASSSHGRPSNDSNFSGSVIHESVQRFSTSLKAGPNRSSDSVLRSTPQELEDRSSFSPHRDKGPISTDQITDATTSSIQPTSVSSVQALTSNGHSETSTAHILHTSRKPSTSVNLQSSHNQLESHSWLKSTPTYKLPKQVTFTSSDSTSSHHVSTTHHVEHRMFSWNETFLQHHIHKLEQRIRILESSMMKLTSSTVPGLREELSKALDNYTVSVKAELLQQKADSANHTTLLKEEIEDNFNKSSTLEERFKKREMDLHRLKTITGQTSMMIRDLANQVSAINMSEFISRLQLSLANFTRSVLTLDQWKLASDIIINTTAEHEAKISHLSDAVRTNTQKTTKLADKVAASQASSRRWYRNLQGHVIQLNNTVQDLKDRTAQTMQKQTKDTQSSQPSMELQSKMDSLHIQLLYNSNRLSGLETTMLNRSLEQCRRATSELEQQASIVRHEQEQKVFRNDLELLQEKVQRIDLSVYRMHTGIKTSDAVVSRLTSDIRHLKPVSSQVLRLEKEVDNLLHQVPRDCQAYYSRGYRESGVYIIYPRLVGRSIRVYCVMEEHRKIPNIDSLSGSNKIIAGSTDDDQKSITEGKETFINDDDEIVNDDENEQKQDKNKKRRTRKKRKNIKGGDISKMTKEYEETEFEDFLRADEESSDILSEDDGLFLDPVESKPSESDLYNGGWTVIQRRYTGKVNFTRSWLQYAMGFGRAMDEYWLGNDVIHLLTNQDNYECRILMTDVFDGVWEARYDHFRMGSQAENYRLQVSGYHGNASDGLSSANHMSFSTLDRDNDASSSHCALYGRGGWWYRHCHISNLNGPFDVGLVWFNRAWRDWVQMKTSLIMVKPRSGQTKT